jgi:hypothetical protein
MAYVPGFDYDLFFSYAQDDSAEWIRALEQSLRQDLVDRLGPDVAIWRDEHNIRFGQNWREEIEDALKASAALLCILSPSYQHSVWCGRERKIFVEHARAANQYKAGRYYRFLKLVRLPWPDNAHEGFFPELQQVTFFDPGQGGKEELEYIPGTKEFSSKLRQAGQAIRSLLLEMRRSREAVFIASSTDETLQAGGELRRELRAQAYDVRPDGPLDDGYADDLIEREMKPAVLSVHLLGATYDPFAEHLIDLAVQLKKRLVFWLTRQAEESPDARQRNLVEQIRKGSKQAGEWALVCNPSSRTVIQDILGMLRPKPAAAPVNTNSDAARVYVLCDPKTAEDAERAREIQDRIHEKEKMRVDLSVSASSGGITAADLHQKMLRECDGLLLYRKAAPAGWLFQTFPDVLFAERLVERPPLRSKAFLVNDPSLLQGIAGVPIIPQSDEFRLSDLEPFLAPLRKREAYGVG